ncbi:hypothetical protein ONS95_014066 [Cadophora gregata]|uniref:uncharacterized protein n=1 Tax=Cadophora gregata TaxID=51156 RepID=UPI0026DB0B23|nr:uncharacterized protein ONS95_014066 [Cadophora gregata]KAK0113818.1 hypothetical protein ONS96_014672 [Cadophora gregata f. sp. sojae]KAK0114578.1 hypothetical protein ONS95_014066 [Cadophora gregata]
MRSHWLAVHGVAAKAGVDWKAVELQTFFRGNLLKYFTNGAVSDVEPKCNIASSMVDIMNVEYDIVVPENVVPYATPPSTIDTSDSALLHHFITNTASTLSTTPAMQSLWENHIPLLAKTNFFLHLGILACSALHLAYLTPTHH